MDETPNCNTCNEYPCLTCIKTPKRKKKIEKVINMNKDEVIEEVEGFLDYGEDEDEFTVYDNGDSFTIEII